MQRYIIEENIHRFEARLKTETDPRQRLVIEALLHDELAKRSALLAGGADSQGAPKPEQGDHPL